MSMPHSNGVPGHDVGARSQRAVADRYVVAVTSLETDATEPIMRSVAWVAPQRHLELGDRDRARCFLRDHVDAVVGGTDFRAQRHDDALIDEPELRGRAGWRHDVVHPHDVAADDLHQPDLALRRTLGKSRAWS